MWKQALAVVALGVAGCASPDLPEAYRSQSQPGAIDCKAFPEPPAPASCRNLYEDIIHRAQMPTIGATPWRQARRSCEPLPSAEHEDEIANHECSWMESVARHG
jgi:hypothetical protein